MQRQTGHTLDTLIDFIGAAEDCGDPEVRARASVNKPPLGLVTNEIGIIFLTSTDPDEKKRAESSLCTLLGHEEKCAYYAAYGYLSMGAKKGVELTKETKAAIAQFASKPENSRTVEEIQSRTTTYH